MVKLTVEQIRSLLASRRDARQDDGFWQDFLCEFHRKQSELPDRRFSSVRVMKWVYGAIIVYTLVTVISLLLPRGVVVKSAPVPPASYQMIQAPVPAAVEPPPPTVPESSAGRAF